MKYPRTPHLPWSHVSKDDKIYKGDRIFKEEVVVTEKRDGSNVCLSRDNLYSRSHSGPPKHRSFDWLKQIHECIREEIPEGYEVFGEWLYARHSIEYTDLESYLEIFAVRDLGYWLPWDELVSFTDELNFTRVPFIYKGRLKKDDLKMYCEGNEKKEGIVVRIAGSFSDEEFSSCVAKYVRKDHVQSDEHWIHQKITPNRLKCT